MVNFLEATGQNPSSALGPSTTGVVIPSGPVYGPIQTPDLRFPSELGALSSGFPFMLFEIVEYPTNAKQFIKDISDASSLISGASGASNKLTAAKISLNNILGNITNTDTLTTRNGVMNPTAPSIRKALITLPISNNITNRLGISWEMSSLAATQAAIAALKGGTSSVQEMMNGNMSGGLTNLAGVGTDLFVAGSVAMFSDLLKRTLNVIANPKMQALFNGVEPRAFQFDFIFTATTQAEANTIEQIIKTFTMYSLPSPTDGYLIMNFPNQFNISFHDPVGQSIDSTNLNTSQPLKGFPVLDACVCTAIETNYTPNGLQLLADGHAVQIVMSVAFLETTLRTQDRPGL
jgi:hypothetical protein